MRPDGTDVKRLTDLTQAVETPGWSPDGTKITYLVHRTEGTLAVHDLYIMNADGTGQLKLASGISGQNTNESTDWAVLPAWPAAATH